MISTFLGSEESENVEKLASIKADVNLGWQLIETSIVYIHHVNIQWKLDIDSSYNRWANF